MIGGYLLEERLGSGAFGEVFKAHRPETPDQKVALKLALAAQGRTLLASEHALAGRVKHPAVVQIHEVSLDSNPPYLVMEYCPGGNLRQRLQQVGRLQADETAHLLAQLLDCLEAAHAAGVVHRDLKPANLLFDAAGRLRLTDFGLGQLNHQTRSILLSQGMQSTGIAGTADYMAPEQKTGEGDERVDLYATGVILFELLTGKRPDRNDQLEDHVDLGPDQARFDRLYQGLCARLEKRFQDVQSVREALARRKLKTIRRWRKDESDTEQADGLRIAVYMMLILILLVGIAMALLLSGTDSADMPEPAPTEPVKELTPYKREGRLWYHRPSPQDVRGMRNHSVIT